MIYMDFENLSNVDIWIFGYSSKMKLNLSQVLIVELLEHLTLAKEMKYEKLEVKTFYSFLSKN